LDFIQDALPLYFIGISLAQKSLGRKVKLTQMFATALAIFTELLPIYCLRLFIFCSTMLFCSVASAITSESVAKMLISISIERLEPIEQSLGCRSGVANRHARSQTIPSAPW
jgi:hypothetical protein